MGKQIVAELQQTSSLFKALTGWFSSITTLSGAQTTTTNKDHSPARINIGRIRSGQNMESGSAVSFGAVVAGLRRGGEAGGRNVEAEAGG